MSFQDLLTRAVEGDAMAFETLVQVYCSDLGHLISKELPASHRHAISTADILQDVRIQGLRDICDFRGNSEASFRAWMRQIAMNRLRDQIRYEERLKRGGNATWEQWLNVGEEIARDRRHPNRDGETPSRAAARNEAAGAVREAIDQLPEQERVAVTLHYLCNFDNKEIAKVMNRTPDAIRALLQRGRNRLRELLGSSTAWISRHE